MGKIFIFDAVNYLFRSYYAIGPMTNNEGFSTSALYGFIRTIKKIITDFKPEYMAIVFDGEKGSASRKEIFSAYKANRAKAPLDLYAQFEKAFEFCTLAGLNPIKIDNFEADDTMAAIADLSKKNNFISYLCTSDKDLMQLVDENTFVLQVHKNNLIFDKNTVKEKYGVYPNQILDFLSIVGDNSDNIPGIAGLGPKGAIFLLEEFGSLDNIYNNLDKIAEKKKNILLSEKENAEISKKLATLNLDVKIPNEIDAYKIKKENSEKLKEFYKKMNFLSFLKDLENVPTFDFENKKEEYILINDEKSFYNLFENLKNQKEIAIDSETTGLDIINSELVGVGFCYENFKAYYLPLNGNIDKNLILEKLKDLLEDENIFFYGHNIKYDYHIFLNHNIKIKNISFDTLLASYLISPQNRKHNLDILCLEKFNINKIPIENLIGKGKNEISMKDVALDKISTYCCEDVDYTYRLKNVFQKILKEKNLETILYDIEIPLIFVLVDMERKGVYVNREKLLEMSKELKHQINLLEGEIFSLAGKQFNINSPKQLSEILFVDLGLPSFKKNFSTSADILEKLRGKSEIIDYIIKYREFNKLLTTYVDSLPNQINSKTNRVHTTYLQTGTATGRLSSINPNLQNIPIRTEEGKKIREGFEPQKNYSYVAFDYSQIELRLLAHFSEDENLIQAFNSNEDIHSYTASLVFNVDIKDVTADQRRKAKAVNFGILYGQSAFGLSEQLNITVKDAKNFIETYFARYKRIKPYLEECIERAQKYKVSHTLTKRQRPILEIDNKNPMIRQAAERLAINTPLQGTAADLIKIAMIKIFAETKKRDLKGFMALQIHDELVFEVLDSEVDIFKKFVKEIMENVFKLKVPLTVDIEVGKSLSEC